MREFKTFFLNKKNIVFFNKPFQHLVVDLDLSFNYRDILKVFSLKNDESIKRDNKNFQKIEIRKSDSVLAEIFNDVQSDKMIELCQEYFGFKSLIKDLSFDGGGFTATSAPGYLRYHHDFPFSSDVNAYRVCNILLYLNSAQLKGGNLHLLDPESKTVEKIIKPKFGRLVIFPTSRYTPHGFSRIESGLRLSINSYFYAKKPLDDRFQPAPTDWL